MSIQFKVVFLFCCSDVIMCALAVKYMHLKFYLINFCNVCSRRFGKISASRKVMRKGDGPFCSGDATESVLVGQDLLRKKKKLRNSEEVFFNLELNIP